MAQRTNKDRQAKFSRDRKRERRQYVRAVKATAEHARFSYFPDAAEMIADKHGRDRFATEHYIHQFAEEEMKQ